MPSRPDQDATLLTPMLRQHAEIKARYPDHLIFFRMGDFYEMFGDDAILGARVLGITLTKRPQGKNGEVPLAGVPHHQAERYLAKLAEAGLRVVVCDQIEDPKLATGLVKRDVTEIITPGTVMTPAAIEETRTPSIAAVVGPDPVGSFGLAWAEPTNGRFAVETCTPQMLIDLLTQHRPDEIVIPDGADARLESVVTDRTALTRWPAWRFDRGEAGRALKSHFHVTDLAGIGLADGESSGAAASAAGALLAYLRETKRAPLAHISHVGSLVEQSEMPLDPQTVSNLDVIGRPGQNRPNLADVLDRCRTPMGRRLLRQRLTRPLIDQAAIDKRLDEVEFFTRDRSTLSKVNEALKGIFDLERFIGRLGSERIGPRDLLGLREALGRWPILVEILTPTGLLHRDDPAVDSVHSLHAELSRGLKDDAPLGFKYGGIFQRGYSDELDALYDAAAEARDWIAALQGHLRADTGIASLKVGYNKVFDYYIEVPKTHSDKVPADWIRRQTLVSAERFITVQLQEKAEIVLQTDERAAELETRLFFELRARLTQSIGILADLSRALARLDVTASLARVALARGYTRPTLTADRQSLIRGGRHPVLETINPAGGFVPNDTGFSDADGWLHLLTGPNMAGKSTYLRQVGLIVLMAQAGSFVPAEQAAIGMVDRIFTRVGADDDLARNRSTFMVEMAETARILTGATARSLILFDEVGRGTSTYDGVAIAWAIAEHLAFAAHECPRTLFATHYHELTALADRLAPVSNYQMAIREKDGRVAFLFRVKTGACDDSFGIHVAKMAGVPPSVVMRANEILAALEDGSFDPLRGQRSVRARNAAVPTAQENLFSGAVAELAELRTEQMTPMEALNKLDELTRRLRGGESHP
ncbi:MAG: DNA mismatch repair protein MutS [candidate division Zixibacteria bacterium]|nr:DNA mismatch repair protein MutS [candidate division Zixibacteria bacterium]